MNLLIFFLIEEGSSIVLSVHVIRDHYLTSPIIGVNFYYEPYSFCFFIMNFLVKILPELFFEKLFKGYINGISLSLV